jgi:periplasmic divalent cation tolerance protein
MDDILVVYVTCADLAEARAIGRTLVEEGLAACANLRPHETIYLWQGDLQQEEEVGLLLKTVREAYPAVERRILALHSYQLPCIVAWPLAAGLPAYGDWVREGVRPQ